MLNRKKLGLMMGLLAVVILALAACQPQSQVVEVTRVVTETVVGEGQPVEVTRIVTEVQEVVATPTAAAPVTGGPEDPTVWREVSFGEPDTLDPALGYETTGGNVIQNVMEPLVIYDHVSPTDFVPALALEVPTQDNGGISEDGLTYTFQIREGVTFHAGGTLEPHDVAYTFQRGLLQSDPNGPQWLLLEPLMGITSGDINESIDAEGLLAGDPAAVQAADPTQLAGICEAVKAAIVADDAAGTVTFNLAVPWGPFLATISQTWGMILDQEWAVEQGAWDGDCATWQNWYAPGAENSELTNIINGTGPYKLDHWTPGEEFVLAAYEGYWRTEETPKWEGGPFGPAALKTVIYSIVDEWGTRFSMMQAGDAEFAQVNPEHEIQMDPMVGEICDAQTGACEPNPENPEGLFRKYVNRPGVNRTDIFPTFIIADGSPYVGSGQLDGNGIPLDFFNDLNVRQALATCFNYGVYNDEVLLGQGVRNNGPIISGMLGYNPDGAMYDYDPAACAAHLEAAWDGALPETGFRFQIAFNTGNTTRQTIGEILQGEFAALNPLYQIETLGLPWPTFLAAQRASQLPVAVNGWQEDIHDPHNWVQPYLVGTYGARQNIPAELMDQYRELVNAGVLASDPAEREQIYFDLQALFHETLPQVILLQRDAPWYTQRWVNGYYYRVGMFGRDYYAMSLAAE
ncbi:putative Peptide/nickel transport system substrate-binding protein [Candidatus Promineifilum breve]|uniref:Peptide/nickel transport system substrate-binding protein n=1 Tax=Candidatus Promineifilum breve TaxID=1806508 RepID=A0A160T2W8_9CHLR|nr:ABC transporter substrate-binding protein [Candidatus Promineifilum breve]CUS04074.2 putative Peptide/nickel transport system substrate-binding protein [Candidatus Promineifilum breve]